MTSTGPRSGVGNVSGYRCVSDCRPKGREFYLLSWRLINKIISTVIFLPSAEPFKEGYCHLQAKVCARSTGEPFVQGCQEKVWLCELTIPP